MVCNSCRHPIFPSHTAGTLYHIARLCRHSADLPSSSGIYRKHSSSLDDDDNDDDDDDDDDNDDDDDDNDGNDGAEYRQLTDLQCLDCLTKPKKKAITPILDY